MLDDSSPTQTEKIFNFYICVVSMPDGATDIQVGNLVSLVSENSNFLFFLRITLDTITPRVSQLR